MKAVIFRCFVDLAPTALVRSVPGPGSRRGRPPRRIEHLPCYTPGRCCPCLGTPYIGPSLPWALRWRSRRNVLGSSRPPRSFVEVGSKFRQHPESNSTKSGWCASRRCVRHGVDSAAASSLVQYSFSWLTLHLDHHVRVSSRCLGRADGLITFRWATSQIWNFRWSCRPWSRQAGQDSSRRGRQGRCQHFGQFFSS